MADASADFERLARGEGVEPDVKNRLEHRPFRTLSNHMYHHLVQLAEAHRIPIQMHTGLQAGNGNYVQHTNPAQLRMFSYAILACSSISSTSDFPTITKQPF